MARRDIHNELDRKNRNNHNDNYKELYRLKQVINDLVLDSGESDAEVVQARAGEETLNDRLDIMEDKTENVSKDMAELEEDLTKETEDRLQATLDEVEDTVQDMVESAQFKGVLLTLNSNQTLENSGFEKIKWDKTIYNISGFWSADSPERITIPAGVKKVRLSANTIWESNNDGTRRIRVLKNGSYSDGLLYFNNPAGGTSAVGGSSAVVEVSEGDYFEFQAQQTSKTNLELRSDPYTWFALEVVEYSKK